MDNLVIIFAIYAISYVFRNLSGPFDVFDIVRRKLLSNSFFGPFFYNLINCPWCIGFHCGYIAYVLYYLNFNLMHMFFWGLVGSFVVYSFDLIFGRMEEKK